MINIAIAVDMKFAKYAQVLLVSIFENNKSVSIYVLYKELTEKIKADYHSLAEKYGQNIELVHIGDIFDKAPTMEKWPVEIYFRLALPYILPANVDRILYLDTDIVNIKPLDKLYGIDMEGKSLAACQDTCSRNLDDIQAGLFEEYEGRESVYYNSGVLLMNLNKIREKFSLDDFITFINNNRDRLRAYDQDTINYMFYNDIVDLPSDRFNLYARIYYNSGVRKADIDKGEVYLIHYTGPKPWSGRNLRTDIEIYWWNYAKMTPYYMEFLENVLYGMMETNFSQSSEYTYLNNQLTWAGQDNERLLAKNNELIGIVKECQELVSRYCK